MTVNNKVSPNYKIQGSTGLFTTTAGFNGVGASYTNASGYQISPSIKVTNEPATLEVKGNIVHNGRDLEERLSVIEKVLIIPEKDVKLEKKYPKLKKMYDEYIKELSKCRMWESLKGDE